METLLPEVQHIDAPTSRMLTLLGEAPPHTHHDSPPLFSGDFFQASFDADNYLCLRAQSGKWGCRMRLQEEEAEAAGRAIFVGNTYLVMRSEFFEWGVYGNKFYILPGKKEFSFQILPDGQANAKVKFDADQSMLRFMFSNVGRLILTHDRKFSSAHFDAESCSIVIRPICFMNFALNFWEILVKSSKREAPCPSNHNICTQYIPLQSLN